jgi:hypothetical protein
MGYHQDPVIEEFSCEFGYCDKTGRVKVVDPLHVWKRCVPGRACCHRSAGNASRDLYRIIPIPIAVAGKTGTAEYCDDVANKAQRCQFGAWPTHAWTLAYAPYDDPEIIVIAFAYNGGEGGSVAAPIVARVIQAYFELKSIDLARTADKGFIPCYNLRFMQVQAEYLN